MLGGNDCFNFLAIFLSAIVIVYKNREHLTLNLVLHEFSCILTIRASFRRAFIRKSLISFTSFAIPVEVQFNVTLNSYLFRENSMKILTVVFRTKSPAKFRKYRSDTFTCFG